jgi:hypothetical protein
LDSSQFSDLPLVSWLFCSMQHHWLFPGCRDAWLFGDATASICLPISFLHQVVCVSYRIFLFNLSSEANRLVGHFRITLCYVVLLLQFITVLLNKKYFKLHYVFYFLSHFTREEMVGKTSAWIFSPIETCWTTPTYWFPSAQRTTGSYSILPTTKSHCCNCNYLPFKKKISTPFFFSSVRVSLNIYDSLANSPMAYKSVINRVNEYLNRELHRRWGQ